MQLYHSSHQFLMLETQAVCEMGREHHIHVPNGLKKLAACIAVNTSAQKCDVFLAP
jgi:hypothetical protein